MLLTACHDGSEESDKGKDRVLHFDCLEVGRPATGRYYKDCSVCENKKNKKRNVNDRRKSRQYFGAGTKKETKGNGTVDQGEFDICTRMSSAMGWHAHPRLGMSIPLVSNVHHPHEVKQGQGMGRLDEIIQWALDWWSMNVSPESGHTQG